MSNKSGRGSVLFKLLIVIFAVSLIAVILIPGEIWEQESYEKLTEENNITSIYEALRFYHRNTEEYTTDPQEILSVVRGDSSILLQQKVVNHTNQLTKLMDSYLKDKFVSSLTDIYQNIDFILEDIEVNGHHFEAVDEYFINEADAISSDLKDLKTSPQSEDFLNTTIYIDSLLELRRDLSDFSLQAGASKAAALTDTLEKLVTQVDVSGLEAMWQPISQRSENFITRVRRSDELSKLTSAGDRIKSFREKIISAFEELNLINQQENIARINTISDNLNDLYETFLRDFIATSKPALYKLSEADSLVIHLTEDNFYSPVTGDIYKIFILDDSSAVKVESPILVNELSEMVTPIANEIGALPILPAFDILFDTLHGITNKAQLNRMALRRNTDVFIKFKEIEEITNNFSNIGVGIAYLDLKEFAEKIPKEESYSKIQSQLEKTFNGSQLFHQAYDVQVFGKLDSLHKDLVLKMEEFNILLDEVKRLPKEVEKYDTEFVVVEQLIADIKAINVISQLDKIINDLEEALVFAAEGKNESVYVIFSKKIKNLGNIYRDKKSWEEEEN